MGGIAGPKDGKREGMHTVRIPLPRNCHNGRQSPIAPWRRTAYSSGKSPSSGSHGMDRLSGSPHSIPFCASPAKQAKDPPMVCNSARVAASPRLAPTPPGLAWFWTRRSWPPGVGAYECVSCLATCLAVFIIDSPPRHLRDANVPRSFFARHPLFLPPTSSCRPVHI